MLISYPNNIETPSIFLTFDSHCLSKIRDSLVSTSNSPSDFGCVSLFTQGHESFAPLITIVIQMVLLETGLTFVDVSHHVGFLSQVGEIRST